MLKPTAADVRAASRLDFSDPDLNYPAPRGGGADPLQPRVDEAIAYVEFVTARAAAVIPTELEPLYAQAVRMRTEQVVMQARADTIDTAGDIDMISSFSAGSYSETRRDTTTAPQRRSLNPWPALNDLLWLLLGLLPNEVNDAVSDRFDYWATLLGIQPAAPAWAYIEQVFATHGGYDPLFLGDSISPYEPWSMYM